VAAGRFSSGTQSRCWRPPGHCPQPGPRWSSGYCPGHRSRYDKPP